MTKGKAGGPPPRQFDEALDKALQKLAQAEAFIVSLNIMIDEFKKRQGMT